MTEPRQGTRGHLTTQTNPCSEEKMTYFKKWWNQGFQTSSLRPNWYHKETMKMVLYGQNCKKNTKRWMNLTSRLHNQSCIAGSYEGGCLCTWVISALVEVNAPRLKRTGLFKSWEYRYKPSPDHRSPTHLLYTALLIKELEKQLDLFSNHYQTIYSNVNFY